MGVDKAFETIGSMLDDYGAGHQATMLVHTTRLQVREFVQALKDSRGTQDERWDTRINELVKKA